MGKEKNAEQTRVFLEHRKAVGIIGFLFMLFFSAIAVIFFHRAGIQRRSFLASFIIPYSYILLTGVGIVLVSFITGAIDAVETRQFVIFGRDLELGGASAVALHIFGIIGEVFMLTSIYVVMPVARVLFRHALIGGNYRHDLMGNYPSLYGLVLHSPVRCEFDLRLHRRAGRGPADAASRRDNSFARRSGDR